MLNEGKWLCQKLCLSQANASVLAKSKYLETPEIQAFMGHHLQMGIASPFPLREVCKSCPEPWTLLLLCSVQGKNQWKKHHDTKPESITSPLVCHLCEAFLTQQCLVAVPGLQRSCPSGCGGLVNVQREVGPWHAGTSPGDNSSMARSLDLTLTYTSCTQSALLSHPGSPEHLGMQKGSVSLPDPAHRTCCHTWGRSYPGH